MFIFRCDRHGVAPCAQTTGPCESAREALLDQTRGESVGLLIYLAAELMDAIEDLGDAATFERFLMWARVIDGADSHAASPPARH